LGIAGGNLERDLATVEKLASEVGSDARLAGAYLKDSRLRRDWVLRTLHRELFAENPSATIAILGLAYKAGTHSVKNSPSLALVQHLRPWALRVWDPVVSADVLDHPAATQCGNPLEAATGADALVVMTPWPLVSRMPPEELVACLAGKRVLDPFGALDAARVLAAGADYFCLGSPPKRAARSV
jgi:UDPglucose 6-dehydrogenase